MLTTTAFGGPGLWAGYDDPRRRFDPDEAQRYATVLIKAAGEGPFLIQERERGSDIEYRGRFSLFGGRQEGGESAAGCAVREVMEETGLELKAADLTLLARVESQNESGRLTSGHLFLAEGLSFDTLKSLDISDGKGVFIKRSDVPRHWGRLTSITHFAIAAYEEMARVRSGAETTLAAPERASLFRFARR